ncbi:hypothetical protein HETIRDRAFT_448750 [Heterobasidion irregulare TC 32-1]|uniref:Uncharacterized protein n=1 Tax=Heterobasidion irregulare (strain TC 32-1) TaxID=747525 RepID=W4KIP6_HETIT|nr:uncharacterized protein HETIRDRAFT_448750 [Heterobasidion irregulare TC 32-1]ETW85728.1 hypothetical protein HETIRDRAFT_448750 [Heterobasidion irregulare TC 32-1]
MTLLRENIFHVTASIRQRDLTPPDPGPSHSGPILLEPTFPAPPPPPLPLPLLPPHAPGPPPSAHSPDPDPDPDPAPAPVPPAAQRFPPSPIQIPAKLSHLFPFRSPGATRRLDRVGAPAHTKNPHVTRHLPRTSRLLAA